MSLSFFSVRPALLQRGLSRAWLRAPLWASCAAMLLLSACANQAIDEARKLSDQGHNEAALNTLVKAAQQSPQDRDLRKALVMQRDLAVADLITQAESLKAAGRKAELAEILARLEQVAPTHPRVAWLRTEVARTQRHERLMKEAQQAMDAKSYEKAEAALRAVLTEDAGNALARSQLASIDELREAQTRRQSTLQLAMADKPVTLEFREASLRTVFEALARAADVNFVFDKDVRSDAKVTLYLKGTTVEEAMRVILNTQQLGYKLLNDNTVLVFPATQQKQRDVLDTVTRTFYLTNADPKQAQTLIRTVAKSRDVFVDERLNLVVVRDTPEVIRLVDRLMQSIDIADPEVMMEIEVMEISKSDSETLGIKWPTSLSYGLSDGSAIVGKGAAGLTGFTTNPLAVASLTASGSDTKILANPKIRARNREKAKVVLAEKLPVFSTTSTPINGGVSNATSIAYVDVGLKLEVEPQVQLDDDVTIKVGLEVSSITNTITSPDKTSVAYQVGTRLANTTLRLRDGETQVLAGLINDTESHSTAGLPYLHDAPLVSRLFGVTTDERKKTEIVMLLTPHIVRNLVQPASSGTGMQSGTETQPGASPMSLRDGASTSGLGGSAGGAALSPRERAMQSRAGGGRQPQISGPEEVQPGSMFVISVRNPDSKPLVASLSIDSGFLAFDGPNAGNNRISLSIPPFGQQQVTLQAMGLATEADTQIELDTGAAPLVVHIKPAQPASPDGTAPQQPVQNDPPSEFHAPRIDQP